MQDFFVPLQLHTILSFHVFACSHVCVLQSSEPETLSVSRLASPNIFRSTCMLHSNLCQNEKVWMQRSRNCIPDAGLETVIITSSGRGYLMLGCPSFSLTVRSLACKVRCWDGFVRRRGPSYFLSMTGEEWNFELLLSLAARSQVHAL